MRLTTILLFSTFLMMGCRGHGPLLSAPGTKEMQQRRAVVHDPYPQNDIAPSIPDGRPRDYMFPPAETVRTRAVPDAMPYLGGSL
jgi:hypothetical protein